MSTHYRETRTNRSRIYALGLTGTFGIILSALALWNRRSAQSSAEP